MWSKSRSFPTFASSKQSPGHSPDVAKVDYSRDVIFTWNGTTTGVRVPDGNWIPDDRSGFDLLRRHVGALAEDIDITKIDALTYSWQKALGGGAAHGMLIPSPRALDRLGAYRRQLAGAETFPPDEQGRHSARRFRRRDDRHTLDVSASRTISTRSAGSKRLAASKRRSGVHQLTRRSSTTASSVRRGSSRWPSIR